MSPRDLIRFESHIERVTESGCWIWMSSVCQKGYGRFRPYHQQTQSAHRLSYRHYRGDIPEGLQLDHLCRVRCCVNPAHLEPVTARENTMRSPTQVCAVRSRSTTCQRGHPLVSWAPNTYFGRKGYRICRVCLRNRANAKVRNRTPEERARYNAYRRGWEARRKERMAANGGR